MTGTLALLAAAGLIASGPQVPAATLTVVSVEPAARTMAARVNSPVSVRFDRPVNRATVHAGSFRVFGRWSGAAPGTYGFSDGDRVVTLTRSRPFSAGESVMVILSRDLAGADGSPLRSAGYSWQFGTRAEPAAMQYAEIDRMTTRTVPTQPTQAYGGIATDLDEDRYLDLTIVHEISADLRIFMNKADGTGLFDPFTQPTTPVADRASPSEPADFDNDGHADICVANIGDNSVSILLGNGDGTFRPQQKVSVGLAPRGIAVLDADGDGDPDIVNTNSGMTTTVNMSLLLNNGSGVFGAPTFFDSGVVGSWALAASDMNNDGILDLVMGARNAQTIVVMAGQGGGVFTTVGTRAAGGRVWMLNCGDLNGDGNEDVATANSFTNNGSILFGNGAGALGAATTYPADPFVLATDLGDADGDGDLDWITSSLNGNFRLNTNNGAGVFTLARQFTPTDAASCALMLDFDNDGDLDLALIDENADEVILQRNSGFGAGGSPPGVPDGTGGTTPLRAARLDPAGVDLSVSWDSLACTGASTDYKIVYGTGSQLPALPGGLYGLSGARCDIGTVSPVTWNATPDPSTDPTGLLWFLVVASDGLGNEGSWGKDAAGSERTGPGANGSSGFCGSTDKVLANACGQ